MKKTVILSLFLILLSSFTPIKEKDQPIPKKIHALFQSLDPTSIAEHIAFYKLYPDTKEGKKAFEHACYLLQQNLDEIKTYLPQVQVETILSLIQNQPEKSAPELSERDVALIKALSCMLKNRGLATFDKKIEKDFLEANPYEIDLARAIIVAECDIENLSIEEKSRRIEKYEAALDLMALQILAKLPINAPAEEMIEKINEYLFYDMGFRFPPHSLYAKDIDAYTFLPSVLDSRRGVCLGVTTLYLCLAQRVGLRLQAITPPGHIFPRYEKEDGTHINIETTARGIDLPDEVYLGIETKKLQKRDNKEVIGLVFFNQASVYWQKKEYKKAIHYYKHAEKYLSEDPLLKELMGYNYLFTGNKKKGKKLLKEAIKNEDEYSLTKNSITEDYLHSRVDAHGIEVVFLSVDETQKSIVEKQEKLKKVLKKYPKFRAGLLQLATTYLQLGREKQAYKILLDYEKIDKNDPLINYYLSVITYKRYDYPKSWNYLKRLQSVLVEKNHDPKAVKELEKELREKCPIP